MPRRAAAWLGAVSMLTAVFVISVGLAVPAARAASVDQPFGPTSQVTDRAGALTAAQGSSVQQALNSLYSRDRLKLFVVYVKNFSGMSPTTWADESAVRAGMGRRDLLLGIATQGRQYAVSTDQDVGLSTGQLDEVAAIAIEPALRASDWAAAAIGAADGYGAAAAGKPVIAPTITPNGGGTSASASSGSSTGVIVAVIVALAVIGGVLFFARRRRAGAAAGPSRRGPAAPAGPTTRELEATAAHLLVTTDDAIKTSEQELGFAAAQFGDEAVAPFATAMTSAKAELAAAFKLRQQLDDDIPEDEPTRRGMLKRLSAHCEKANELLDEQAAAFDKLRNLEENAPLLVPQLAASADRQQARLEAARATLGRLGAAYAPSAVADVDGNVDEAASRLAFLRDSAGQARQALEAGDAARAAVLVQAAQLADDQVTQLLDGVDRRARELPDAAAALPAALGEAQANVAEAAASDRPGLREAAARAQAVTDQVRGSLTAGPGDPLASLRAVEEINARLDQALAGARAEQVRQQHARAALEQAVLTARSSIAAANDFIITNRGGVGSAARTHVAEAQRHLDRALALAAADAENALAETQQADAMAQQAYLEAQRDVSRFAGAGQGMGPFGGGGSRGGGGSGVAGAVLGGILINSILGGGGGAGRGLGGFGGRGPMRQTAGSFGGSRTRGRHSVGGRF